MISARDFWMQGMDPEMPAAILQKGTTAGQKKIVATVSTLEAEVKRQGIETPAIIVVGKVCALADEFDWYEKASSDGMEGACDKTEGQKLPYQQSFQEKRERRFWNFHPSVPWRWKTRARFIRHLMRSASISGWYLPARQGQRFSLKKCSPCRKDIRCLVFIRRWQRSDKGTAKVLEERGTSGGSDPGNLRWRLPGRSTGTDPAWRRKDPDPACLKGKCRIWCRILEEARCQWWTMYRPMIPSMTKIL